jgi:hypothetical protein
MTLTRSPLDPGRSTFERGAARPADQTTVRRANLGVVLRHVASSGSRSRAQIAAETGLTRGTVSSLVTELIDLELLRETGETASPRGVGRPGVALELARVVVGVGLEVNVDYVAVSAEDLTGAVRYERRSYRDNRASAPGPVLDRLARAALAALDAVAHDRLRPVGISVAVPGLVEEGSGTVVFAPNLGWSDQPVANELETRLGVPVHVENESNLAALAEHWTGAAVGIDDFVCVFGEVGVGGGVVLGGAASRRSSGRSRSPARPGSRPPRAARAASPTSWCDVPRPVTRRSSVRSATPAAGSGSRSPRRSTCSTCRPSSSEGASAHSRRGSSTRSARRSTAGRSRPGRVPSMCFPRRSAMAQPCAAPRRSRCGACSTRRGRSRQRPRASTDTRFRPRRSRPGVGRRWRSGVARKSRRCV